LGATATGATGMMMGQLCCALARRANAGTLDVVITSMNKKATLMRFCILTPSQQLKRKQELASFQIFIIWGQNAMRKLRHD
jgi:hypothetical protein